MYEPGRYEYEYLYGSSSKLARRWLGITNNTRRSFYPRTACSGRIGMGCIGFKLHSYTCVRFGGESCWHGPITTGRRYRSHGSTEELATERRGKRLNAALAGRSEKAAYAADSFERTGIREGILRQVWFSNCGG